MPEPHPRLLVSQDPSDWRHTSWPEFKQHVVLTPEGVFSVKREGNIVYRRPALTTDLKHPFVQKAKDHTFQGGIEITPRVPYQLLLQAIAFFRIVWQKQRREDVLLLYLYEQPPHYRLFHPVLKAAGVSRVEYIIPDTPDDAVRCGSIHSHGADEAYHSPTDERDDQRSPGIHVVVGDLDRPYYSVRCFASDGRVCFEVPLWDVFLEPTVPSLPSHWLVELPPTQRSTSHDFND